MKKASLFILLISVLISCNYTQTSDDQLADKTETINKEANAQIGVPAIKNFQEKRLLKDIYELRDQADLVMYAYLFASQTGKLIFLGKCIGYGIPYATQYSNPKKIIKFDDDHWYAGQDPQTIDQSEPNGLFMPTSANATWIILIGPDGTPHPTYVEPDVIVSPTPLNVN